MSVSSVGTSTNAYAYLQSLLPPQSADGSQATGSADPVRQLLDAFYPNGAADPNAPAADGVPSASGATPSGSAIVGPPFSPDNLSALMSAQEQQPASPFVTAQAQDLFAQFDANGDGQVSKSEFENVFGSNADTSKVDGLFNALDSNGDGSVSADELTSAAQASHAQHHGGHHHHHVDSGQGGDGGLLQALDSSGTQGASTDTASNSDGSNTTTITYADGSKVSVTSPPGSSGSGSSDAGPGPGTDTSSATQANLLEQLIRLQAQSLSVATSQNLATI